MKEESVIIERKQFDNLIEKSVEKNIIYFVLDMDRSKEIIGINELEDKFEVFMEEAASFFKEVYFTRIGRDAFAGVHISNHYTMFDIARIKEEYQQFLKGKYHIPITFCMGIAEYPEICKDKSDISAFAIDALYLAKSKGENIVESSSNNNMKMRSFYFRVNQLNKLNYLSKKTKQTESEIVRKALDHYIESQL